jgi:DNA-binding NtrC family response regulator
MDNLPLVIPAGHLPATTDQATERFGLVGASPGMREVFRKIELYARSDAAVIVTGETGTGKELVARALHACGPRRTGPFVAVNCAAIAAELLESELFGHERGAFTGALRTHRGRFERAHGGTIFLDEVGDMPSTAQAKLLRILEEGLVERVGAERPVAVDVRVVGATNLPLEQAVHVGRFRADLYHRLAVLRIKLPPLRQRPEDIPLLVEHFLRQFRRKYGHAVERLTPEAMALLDAYLWPGNVRELRNVLERVFVESHAEVIGARAFREWVRERQDFTPGEWGPEPPPAAATVTPPWPLPGAPAETVPASARRSTRPANLETAAVRRAWQAATGNLTRAARLLGVHRATLYRSLKRLNLSRSELDRR